MASVKFNKGSEEWLMFMDYWALCQKYWKVDKNTQYWQDLISDCDLFLEKYTSFFASRLIMALLDSKEKEDY